MHITHPDIQTKNIIKEIKVNMFKINMNPNTDKMYLFMLLLFIYTIKIIFTNIMLLVDIYKTK